MDILVCLIEKIVWTCAAGGSQTLDFLHERRTPYPLGQVLRILLSYADTSIYNLICILTFHKRYTSFAADMGKSGYEKWEVNTPCVFYF